VTAPVLVSEASFLSAVVDYARLKGWRVHHQRPAYERGRYRSAIQGDSGFPDLVLARRGRIQGGRGYSGALSVSATRPVR
jgi:hypothetical protein